MSGTVFWFSLKYKPNGIYISINTCFVCHWHHFRHSFLLRSAQTCDSSRHHTPVGPHELTENQYVLKQQSESHSVWTRRSKRSDVPCVWRSNWDCTTYSICCRSEWGTRFWARARARLRWSTCRRPCWLGLNVKRKQTSDINEQKTNDT